MNVNEIYLQTSIKRFQDYKLLAEKAMNQLEPELLFKSPNEDSNSIAIIVQHMAGNMLSRWTHFLTEDGEKSWRERDREFEIHIQTKEELMKKWEEGWTCCLDALKAIKPDQLLDIVHIRGEAHSVIDAIQRQLAHYPYHVGQIVYAAKWLKNGGFESLSIPKKKSAEFNAQMFGKKK